jgi:hypothetical protein
MKNLKKIKHWLLLWDGVWSIPLALLMFVLSGTIIQWFFADPLFPENSPGFYDPSFIQAAFFASAMQVFLNFTAWLGLYFNFRGMWKYFVGKLTETGETENKSHADFLKLTSWQRIVLLVFLYVFLSAEWLLLFSLLL